MLVTTGVVTVSHYCMDKLASVSFYTTVEKKCGKCGMEKGAHHCCNDQENFAKVKTDHFKAHAVNFKLPYLNNGVLFATDYLLSPLQNSNAYTGYQSHPPPLLLGNDLYLANNVFRI